MNILITGSTGSVGSKITKILSKNHRVTCIDPRNGPSNKLQKYDLCLMMHGGHHSDGSATYIKNCEAISTNDASYIYSIKDNGCLIIMSSRRAVKPTMKEWNYAAAKAALRAYSLAIYKDYPNLRITCLCPGWIESKQATDEKIERVISCKDLANLIETIALTRSIRIPEIFMEPIGEAEY